LIRVGILEDELILAELLREALAGVGGFEVVGVYSDGGIALQEMSHLNPDAVILDVLVPGELNGLEVGVLLRKRFPRMGVVVLSSNLDASIVNTLDHDSILGWGFLDKGVVKNIDSVARAIRASVRGEVVFDEEMLRQCFAKSLRTQEVLVKEGIRGLLTSRQQEIMLLVAQGYTNKAISKRLYLSERTVEHHLADIYLRLGIDSEDDDHHRRVRAVLRWIQEEGDGC